MKPPPSPASAAAASARPFVSFLRFAALGGTAGVLSSLAVPLLAAVMPWAAANAVVTAVTTVLSTELHARITFTTGRSARPHEHAQSAATATAAYLATGTAVGVLHLIHPAAGALTEQAVYLTASALAGIARFLFLRHRTFAARPSRTVRPAAQPAPVSAAGRTSGSCCPAPGRSRPRPGSSPSRTAAPRAGRACLPGLRRPSPPSRWPAACVRPSACSPACLPGTSFFPVDSFGLRGRESPRHGEPGEKHQRPTTGRPPGRAAGPHRLSVSR